MPESSTKYFYIPVEDARKCCGMRVNIFAVVVDIGTPRRCRGSDLFLTLKIVDQSCAAKLSVKFFAKNQSKLPEVMSEGDIICLHMVEVKIHDKEPYCSFIKGCSSFALFVGKNGDGCLPYQTSTSYHATKHDDYFLSTLRKWLLGQPTNAGLLPLRSIKVGDVFDLVCKVLHVCDSPEGDWMLFVWDGTDAPPASFPMDLDNEGETPCPLHAEVIPLSRETLCTFPYLGTILRINASTFFKEVRDLQGCVKWVRLCSIKCHVLSGMWKGELQPSSKIHFLSDNDTTVLHQKRLFEARRTYKVERQPMTSFPSPSHILETDYEDALYWTLLKSLTYRQVLHKFKSIVRVVSMYPWRPQDLRSLDGHYRIRVTLEDPTARVHAFICKEDGEYFFGGHLTNDELSNNLRKLLGITEDGRREPPWVWCCLTSYYLDKSDPWGSRRYRIISTRLVG